MTENDYNIVKRKQRKIIISYYLLLLSSLAILWCQIKENYFIWLFFGFLFSFLISWVCKWSCNSGGSKAIKIGVCFLKCISMTFWDKSEAGVGWVWDLWYWNYCTRYSQRARVLVLFLSLPTVGRLARCPCLLDEWCQSFISVCSLSFETTDRKRNCFFVFWISRWLAP